MEVGKLNAQLRPLIGTGNARKLRVKGQIPAICYGGGEDPIQINVSPTELQKSLDPVKGRNTLLRLNIEGGEGGAKVVSVMLKDAQREPTRGSVVHADFLRVHENKPVRATVPLSLVGKAPGVKDGGTLHQVYRSIVLSCLPGSIPAKIDLDISALGMGQSIHVGDLKLPEGVSATLPASSTLCVVTAPRAEKGEAGAAEGGADAAAGDKAAASSKTPAPKAGGDKAAAAKPAAAAAAKPAAKK